MPGQAVPGGSGQGHQVRRGEIILRAACLCGRPERVTDPAQGEVVCGGCGIVMESRVCEAEAAGAGSLMEGMDDWGVGTLLPGDARGAEAVAVRRSGRAAALSRVLVQLRRMADTVGAGRPVREEAYSLARRLVASGFAACRDRMAVAAAALMLACRIHGRVLEWGEIPGISHKMRRIMRAYRELQYVGGACPVGYSEALVSRICSDLDLPVRRARDAVGVLQAMRESRFTGGKKPQCVAAAAVALSGGSPPTKRRIAEAARISEPGLRNVLAAWKSYPGR